MKAKAILVAGIFAFAAAFPSFAQVYSVNAVGFAKVTVPANGYMMLANPLNGSPDNNLNTILPLPDGYDGASVYRFNPAIQSYRDTMQWVGGVGWLASDPADLLIAPGEGFFIQNIAPTPLSITFLGEVPSGIRHNPILGNGKYQMLSSIVPKAGRLGWPGLPGTLEFPACTGDSIFIFDPICQCYRETYQYVDGFGWYHDVDPPEGPFIDVANGFFLQRVCPDDVLWTMTFSVGP
jgi:hypothetical protein